METYVVKKAIAYTDGGTILLETDKGVFSIDHRIDSATKSLLYDGYPRKDNANIIPDTDYAIRTALVEAAKSYRDEYFPDWDVAAALRYCLPPPKHWQQVELETLRKDYPKAARILAQVRRIENMDTRNWDTNWEKELTQMRRIVEILTDND